MEVEKNSNKTAQVAIVMVPLPAQGHINPLLHLSHLITSYGLPVHFAGSSFHNRRAKLRLHGWDQQTSTKVEFHDFPLSPYSSLPLDLNAPVHFPTRLHPLFHVSMHLREPVYRLIRDLSTKFKRIIVIHDSLMSSIIQDVKLIPNAQAYTFIVSSAFYMFMSIWESLTEKPFQLDSDIPSSVPSRECCFNTEAINFISKQREFQNFQSGKLFNTSRVIEGRYLELMEKLSSNANMKLFAIGPFNPVEIKNTRDEKRRHECLEWLDKQEADSVLYVSFGSTTTLSDEQIRELAKGLEKSEQKFVWALKAADKGNVLVENEGEKPKLPEGYEERVKNRGIVVRDWAPQLEILGHPSIAWFMSHCGWNSCLESLSMGVAVATWPMHSDQPKNAILLTEVLRIGIMVRDWESQAELVTSDVIENVVRRLMTSEEGKEASKRVKELGEAVRGSVAEGGASRLEMESFIAHITR